MRANMASRQSNVNRTQIWTRQVDRKGRANDMTIDVATTALAAIVFIGPLAALAAAAIRFGVDSRPGIDDRDQRPWLVGR
jgi:hypothetical protein